MKQRVFEVAFGTLLLALQVGWILLLGWGFAQLVS